MLVVRRELPAGNSRFRFRYYRRYLQVAPYRVRCQDFHTEFTFANEKINQVRLVEISLSPIPKLRQDRRRGPLIGVYKFPFAHAKLITGASFRIAAFPNVGVRRNGVTRLAAGWLFSQMHNAGARVKFHRCGVC